MSVELIHEWVSKAEQDWQAAIQLFAWNAEAVPDVIAFHAQQTAEKYLKALLIQIGVEPPPTHDLGQLVDLLTVHCPEANIMREDAESLTPFAVRFRYPRLSTTADRACKLIEQARRIRAFVRRQLGLAEE